jgi:hypothetical protein
MTVIQNTTNKVIKPRRAHFGTDYIGKRFGRLVVIKKTGEVNKFKQTLYLCKCDCGNSKDLSISALKVSTQSCGCLKRERDLTLRGQNHPSWRGYEELPMKHWNQILDTAKKRSLTVDITIQQAYEAYLKQNKLCALSGVEISLNLQKNRNTGSASLDRIDSSKGYSIDNIQWVHKDLNKMKGKLMDENFIGWCHIVSKHHSAGLHHPINNLKKQ